MKIKGKYILSEVDGSYVAVQVGEAADPFQGIVRLNKSGAFIWEKLEQGLEPDEITRQLTRQYEGLDEETARRAVDSVVETLKAEGILEE